MQVAVKHMPVGSLIMGVDLVPIRPIRGAFPLQEDITSPKCKASIVKLMKGNGCNMLDAVLHDGLPNVGGAGAQEATTQAPLVVDASRLAVDLLSPRGTFVSELFEKVEVAKPVASRSTSAEIYVVGLRDKDPAKINPRLLDVKHHFQAVVEPPKVVDVLRGSKQKYEGLATVWKTCLASDFVWSVKSLDVLGSVTSISFDDPVCSTIKEHSLTTDEALSPQESVSSLTKEIEKAVEGIDDECILNEMDELCSISEQKKKKAKRLLAKRRAKDKVRAAMVMEADAMEDDYTDDALFSLASLKAKRDLQVVDSPAQSDDDDNIMSEDETIETNQGVHNDSGASDIDYDEERKR